MVPGYNTGVDGLIVDPGAVARVAVLKKSCVPILFGTIVARPAAVGKSDGGAWGVGCGN